MFTQKEQEAISRIHVAIPTVVRIWFGTPSKQLPLKYQEMFLPACFKMKYKCPQVSPSFDLRLR